MSDVTSEVRDGIRFDADGPIAMDDGLDRNGSVRYHALGDGVTFLTPPLPKETEITGPLAALRPLCAVFTGVGPFQHNDARDRPPAVFGKSVTVHSGPARPAHLLLPIIPPGAPQ